MFSKSLLLSLTTFTSLVFSEKAAEVISNNPTDVVLRADFPSAFSQNVVGIIQFYSLNGTTKVHVDITGLPKNAGVFQYHIHENPVGEDGDCEATGKHFNPFGASPECESQKDDSLCQVGDLSGKHGLINTTCFETYFYDPYLSLDPSSTQYIGNKAINIHLENLDKLACANIKISKEPEDLVLLDYEAEAEQVKQYEEITGVKIEDRFNQDAESEFVEEVEEEEDHFEDLDDEEKSASDYSRRDENSTEELVSSPSESEEQEIVEEIIVEEEELENDAESESDDDEESSLDDLIYEDIEKHRSNYGSGNSTFNYTYGNVSGNISGEDGKTSSENNGVSNISNESFIGSIIIGFIMAYLV